MQRIAIYDMDKTITRRATWTPFLIHAAGRRTPWRLALLPIAAVASIAYLVRLIDRVVLKEFAHRLMIGRVIRPEAIAPVAESFARQIMARGVFADASAQMARDRQAGYRIVIATASHSFYVAAIARALGIADVIATEAKRDAAGAILHRIDGDNCYGAAKLDRIIAWLGAQGIDRAGAQIRFYSDHVSDAPALGFADEGFVINPDPVLEGLAQARGWGVLDWR